MDFYSFQVSYIYSFLRFMVFECFVKFGGRVVDHRIVLAFRYCEEVAKQQQNCNSNRWVQTPWTDTRHISKISVDARPAR